MKNHSQNTPQDNNGVFDVWLAAANALAKLKVAH